MKQKQRGWLKQSAVLLLIAMLLVLSACGGNHNSNNGAAAGEASASPTAESNASAQPSSDPAQTAYPLTVKDATGTELTFDAAPQRVVTLLPSETEIVYAIGSGDEVAGVDAYSNYPPEAADKPKIGDMTTNIEAVAALNPDLVLASSTMNTDAVQKLRDLGLTVYASDPKTYDAVIDKIKVIGQIMNKQAEADQIAKHMQEVKQQVADKVKGAAPVKTYLEFSEGYTVGKGEFLDELLTIAGGQNTAGDQSGWFEVDAEKIIQENPAVIVYPALQDANPNPILEGIKKRAGWDAIDAVKNNRIVEVSDDPLVRVGPRLADGLLELAKAIHPELFS
ncbi:ABC transporter substrate-binding protein [Paenibacillus protaetiae]|uniref:ABC transporter substrate-binding protein n=1 Tax=Paenibacillus protaetiae TaxID=2509456 RepID=A0A4P6ESX9_9BACL|nr:ABC transporter substrate-binding protein [Paenibacillus protaetiae]QAY65686.1 ABC transporter substrate-binding protein [Paenibacillus protaetiae]